MIQKIFIPSSFVEPLISYIAERDLKAPELEQELLSLKREPSMCAMHYSELLYRIQDLDPVPALGFRLGMAVTPRNFGVMGYLFLSCNNLGQALTRYGRFQTLVQTGLKSWVIEDGKNLKVSWKRQAASEPLTQEFSVAAFVRLYQELIGKDIPPIRVGIQSAAPDDASFHEAVIGCPVSFNSDALIVEIPAQLMSMRITSSDPYLRQLLEQQAQALLEQSSSVEGDFSEFFEVVQDQLIKAMKDGDISAEVVARKMGFSLRSFYRKLSSGGHSFRSILSEIRLRLAKQYLADESLSHSEVALLLGYSEQSSFIRAFRNWTGLTPGEYREKLEARQR